MMDQQLRDNVERLLRGGHEQPSAEFKTRLEGRLHPPATADRRRSLLPLAAVAATILVAFLLWLTRPGDSPAPSNGSPQGQEIRADLRGTVRFRGDLPAPKKYPAGRFGEKFEKAHPDGLVIHRVSVDEQRRVRGCLVYVKKGLEGKTFEVPKEPKIVRFDQYQLRPRATALMTGQELIVENLDDDLHNAHALPWNLDNREFNTGLPERGQTTRQRFTVPEPAIKLKCDVHEVDRAWITVLPHPFSAVTDENGRYEIRGLPPGKYTLEAWQENCLLSIREVEIKGGGMPDVDFDLEPGPGQLTARDFDDQKVVVNLEGKTVYMFGALHLLPGFKRAAPPFHEGTTYVFLGAPDKKWGGYCGIAKDSEPRLSALANGTYVALRGRIKTTVGVEGGQFVMEECTLDSAPVPKSGR